MKLTKRKIAVEELYLDKECRFKVTFNDMPLGERCVHVRGPWISGATVHSSTLPKGKLTSDEALVKQVVKKTQQDLKDRIKVIKRQLKQQKEQVTSCEKYLAEVQASLKTTT